MSPVDKRRLKILKQLTQEEQAILDEMVNGKESVKDAKAGDGWEERLAALRKWHRLCKQSGLV
ncbi:MAG TPA: hypothetical protein VKD72_02285 [Gemmataceae bacterium]|nr:hypothetical protein [Gemmataceae bacterium]